VTEAATNPLTSHSILTHDLLHCVVKYRARAKERSGVRVVIGAPGNGADLKDAVKEFLEQDERVTEVVDLSRPDITYPDVSFQAAQQVVDGKADRAVLVCGTGVGTAIAASKVPGARAATGHDLVTVRGAVENYDAQILCMGQNVIAPAYARSLLDVWLDARHDPSGFYGPKVREIDDYETRGNQPGTSTTAAQD